MDRWDESGISLESNIVEISNTNQKSNRIRIFSGFEFDYNIEQCRDVLQCHPVAMGMSPCRIRRDHCHMITAIDLFVYVLT